MVSSDQSEKRTGRIGHLTAGDLHRCEEFRIFHTDVSQFCFQSDKRRCLGDGKETEVDPVRRAEHPQGGDDHQEHWDGVQRHGT